MYRLAEAGETSKLLAHIGELQSSHPKDENLFSLALIAAAESNQIETSKALLQQGASIEGTSERPWIRPLWKAAKRGHLQMVKFLVEHGANVNATDNQEMNALAYAKRYGRKDVERFFEALTTAASNPSFNGTPGGAR